VLSPESHLRQQGLTPLAWDEILTLVEQKLTPTESQTFQRLHRAFAAYPAAHTVRAFYDFAAQRDLLALLAGFRFERLVDLAGALSTQALAGRRALDYGAGGGYLAAYLRAAGAEVTVADFSPATLRRLETLGYPVVAGEVPPAPDFDLILCADSLGEVNADEDDWLAAPENLGDPNYPGELNARYGFAEKLAPLKSRLAANGFVLLFEPVRHAHFWQGAARALEGAGWKAEVLTAPVLGLKLRTGDGGRE
jgi:SAM-dependent methyltransferase